MFKQIKKGVFLASVFLFSSVSPVFSEVQDVKMDTEMVFSNSGEKFIINSSIFYGNKKIRIDSEVNANNPNALPAGFGRTRMLVDNEKNQAYMITPQTKTALKMDLKMMHQIQGVNQSQNLTNRMISDPAEIKAELKKQGGKMIGAEKVLGYLCDIWQAPMQMPNQEGKTENVVAKVWMANKINIPLKIELTSPSKGKFVTINTKNIKTDFKFESGTFDIPKDYKITDFAQMMNQTKKLNQK